MKNLVVSLDAWRKCFSDTHIWRKPDHTKDLLLLRYGIEHLTKLNEYDCRLTFVDDEKMTYWLLRWG